MTDLTRDATPSDRITIYYPFHPLRGRRFRPIKTLSGLPPTYVIQRADGRRFGIPVWMTERAAAELDMADQACIDPSALIQIAGIVVIALCDLTDSRGNLPGKSACKEGHNDESNTADALSARGDAATSATDTSSNQGRNYSTHRRVAASGGNRETTKRRRAGGAR